MQRFAVVHRSRSLLLALFGMFLLVLAPIARADQKHEFLLDATQWNDKPKSVHLAGDFNGWSKDAAPMKQVKPNVWAMTLDLTEGLHHYKFVIDGERWIGDPDGDKQLEEDDNYGGRNSGVMVGPDVRKLPPPQPNHVNKDGVVFDQKDPLDVNYFERAEARLRLRAQADDIQTASVGDQPLYRLTSDRGIDTFGGVVRLDSANGSPALSLRDGTDTLRIALNVQSEVSFQTPDWAKHAVWYQIFPERFRNGDPSNDPGDKWFEHLEPWKSNWWATLDKEAPGKGNFYKGEGNVWKRRYGGDIQGLKQELPYLRSLGITAIYLNPMFEAESMHKYDTADYRHIDDNFGVREKLPLDGETDDPQTWKWSKSDLIFLDFVAEAHHQGFKVILDGVFNHVGRAHPFFQDVVKNGKQSKYADWFEIRDFGNKTPADPKEFGKPGGMKFNAWGEDSGHLPVLKKDPKLGLARGPREHIMAITKRWLAPDGDPSKGIDGWRLDVPGDIPHPFWIDWRKLVKSTKPDAYISGEIWTWAQPWLNKGDQFDAVMNYRLAEPVQQFFVNQKQAITPEQFNARLVELEFNYPMQVALVQMNLFDSHDTDRAASMYVNPDRAYDAANRIQDNAEKMGYNPRRPNDIEWARMRQAVAFQMTFLGAPMIYYGDEAGMWGPDDPSNRQPLVWKDLEPYDDPQVKFDQAQFEHYQRCIAIRKALSPLQLGFFRPVLIDNERKIYAFAREMDGKNVYVVINKNDGATSIDLLVDMKDAIDWMNPDNIEVKQPSESPDARPIATVKNGAKSLSSSGGKLTVELKPYGTAILAERSH
jgi:glycosidase